MAIVIKRKAAPVVPEPIVPTPKKTPTVVMPEVLDGMCLHVLEVYPNGAIAWWLIASYLYYVHDIALLSDGLYDEIAKAMLEAWDDLEHIHKHLITVEDLKTGSLFKLKGTDYPSMVKGAAAQLVKNHMGIRIDVEK